MTYERPYFYDAQARCGISPMDKQLGISGSQSNGLRQVMTWLATLLPYGKAAEVANRVGQLQTSDASLWEVVQAAAEGAQATITPVTTQKTGGSERMGIAIDGCMMNVRNEGWKEVKLGAVFQVKDCERSSNPERDMKCVETSCVAHLGGPEGLSNQLAAEAQARDFQKAEQQAVLGDAAEWIWNIANNDYPGAAQINDWYHSCEHLSTAAKLLFVDQPDAQAAWVDQKKTMLFAGSADLIALEINAHALRKTHTTRAALNTEADYFAKRVERMQYEDFRKAGLPIGSGVIEAVAKCTKQRMSGSGMRWSRSGATNLLPFHSAELSGSFDRFWARVCP